MTKILQNTSHNYSKPLETFDFQSSLNAITLQKPNKIVSKSNIASATNVPALEEIAKEICLHIKNIKNYETQIIAIVREAGGSSGAVQEAKGALSAIQRAIAVETDDLLTLNTRFKAGLESLQSAGIIVDETAAEVSYVAKGTTTVSQPLSAAWRFVSNMSQYAQDVLKDVTETKDIWSRMAAADARAAATVTKTAGITGGLVSFGIWSIALIPVTDVLDHMEHNAKMNTDPLYRDNVLKMLYLVQDIKKDRSEHPTIDNTGVQSHYRPEKCADSEHKHIIDTFIDKHYDIHKQIQNAGQFMNASFYKDEMDRIANENTYIKNK